MADISKPILYTFYGGYLLESSFQMIFLSSLVAFFAWYVFRQPPLKEKPLTKLEEEELIEEFEPDELIPEANPEILAVRKRVVTSKAGKYVTIDGATCLNLATHNYLSFIENTEVESNTSESINKYGVGSCGPRGFYGTVDVHLELEEKLAEYMEVEEACVYSYGFATIASAIPAYAKRSDIVFVDEAVNFAVQKGLDASRSVIRYFKHNDMVDLERLLKEQEKEDLKNPKKAKRTRKFLIAEGIYLNTGVICNLPELVKLRKEYKLRMILDESVSFGTLGATGKGVVEYFGIPNTEVDLRIGSMEGSLASIGGFCCGASFIVEHQRLSGLGYCFSASLPPMLAVAALTSLEHMKNKPELFQKLQDVSQKLHKSLLTLTEYKLGGDPNSPIKHLYLKEDFDFDRKKKILDNIVQYCIEHNLAVVSPEYLTKIEKFPIQPSLRLTANVEISEKEIETAVHVLSDAYKNNISSASS